ncbi:Taurine catabolism dioxygenase TauD/TfdA [Moritella viscosa]|uniref:TauD/TfdA family dioxygenase n=1 Tax=Moritella viscosa TaxID=80854 RepID=UPI000509187E|nr:TauD/TfdA family dioxygenase [Moritella viscosa]CED60458.1 putative uncharacterized protein [Moritella viscosa]SHO13283.1 Taurine catabolism dioxygenase TauD/TfdA [Moritella viscosa]SHO23290.1 Taurine catabolism dioxygenase TauD/TfdA [Moritella viscosa]
MISFKKAVTDSVSANNVTLLSELFYRQGFVVVDGNTLEKQDKLVELASILQLDEPYVSNYNKKYFPNKTTEKNVAAIGYNLDRKDDYSHPVFEESKSLGQHVDGTFSPLGEVKTTLLLCLCKANQGGETTLFNGFGAIKYIESKDPTLSNSLKDKNALRRRSAFDGIDEECVDCVFGYDPVYEREIIRLAFDASADWEFGFERVVNLQQAVTQLKSLYDAEGEYYLCFPLGEGDIIVMDNTRITHGRTSFTCDIQNPRLMIRSIHKRLPA